MKDIFKGLALGFLLFASSGSFGQGFSKAQKPNILFILADDQTFETLGALNNPEIHTPNLDRLIKQGTCFTQAYIQGSWQPAVCVASRASLITGSYVWKAAQYSGKANNADKNLRASLVKDVLPVAKKIKRADLVDIRGADEFSGKLFAAPGFQELSVRAGHIPGAVNVPWGANVNADGTFKTVAELKKLYADKGITGAEQIITYCRIGERSSLTWFVLSEILGYQKVKNYDGSWTEYGNSVGVPINNPSGTIWGAA